MPLLPTPNEKAAAVTSCDGLDFILRTTTLPLRKDSTDDLYHTPRARRKP